MNAVSVDGLRFQLGFTQKLVVKFCLAALFLLIKFNRLLFRVQDRNSEKTVDDHPVAVFHPFDEVVHADDCGNSHGTCQNRAVRGFTSRLRGESKHIRAVEQRRVGRSQILCDDDTRPRQMVKFRAFQTVKIRENARCDILNIGGAFAQIRVRHRGNRRNIFLHGLGKRGIGMDQFFGNRGADLVHQHFVIDDQEMGVEDIGFMGFERSLDTCPELLDLVSGLVDRLTEQSNFGIDLFRRNTGDFDVFEQCTVRLRNQHNRPDCNPRRCRNPVIKDFPLYFLIGQPRSAVTTLHRILS